VSERMVKTMPRKPWHYPSVKAAIQMFIDEHKPSAFTSKSIEKEVVKNYQSLIEETEYANYNNQPRQRPMLGKIIHTLPAVIEGQYVRKRSRIRTRFENWDGSLINRGTEYYCRIDTQEEE